MISALSMSWRRRRLRVPPRFLHCLVRLTAALSAVAAPPVAAAEFAVAPGQTAVGDLVPYVVKTGDLFPDIARRFDVGYTELVAANPGVDPWAPGAGRTVTIPGLFILPNAPHQGIVINLAQSRLFYFPPGGDRVETYPLGIGMIGKTTPLGMTRVTYKEPNPTWYPPPSIHAEKPELPAFVPPGPDNPLGAFALHLGWRNYLIHGTNKPDGVGRNVSHGCIRLYPEDIEELFGAVGVGTPVRTVDQPATAGRIGDRLYLAVYPSKTQIDEIDTERPVTYDPAEGVPAVVSAAAGRYADSVDWTAVDRAAQQRTGMPVTVADTSAYAGDAAYPYARQPAQPYDNRGPLQTYGREVEQPYDEREAVQSYDDRRAAQPYGRRPVRRYDPWAPRPYYDREVDQ
jgi:L,D-transpeptidase ErfK/SrfK